MEVLKFVLSGRTAFFKKPDVNTYCYFTYGNIHKVALLGLFGAIAGYGGYGQMKKDEVYPEFYNKLRNLEIAIAPDEYYRGSFPKKMQSFNNSVGYASSEKGGNLVVKQYWLEDPRWEIYVKVDCEEGNNLANKMMDGKSAYIPYLGSNAHPADITSVELVTAEELTNVEGEKVDSIFPAHAFSLYDEMVVKPYK